MNNLIELTINQYNMVDYGGTVIVALSGGADSVCLLHNLVLLKDKYNLKIMACHLNHHCVVKSQIAIWSFARNFVDKTTLSFL